MGLRDQNAAVHLYDAPRLGENQFDQARISFVFRAVFRGPGSGERRRVDFAQIHDGAFRFGNDFLRHRKHD